MPEHISVASPVHDAAASTDTSHEPSHLAETSPGVTSASHSAAAASDASMLARHCGGW